MLSKQAIKNIRFGVATNSSSTHSIIHNPELANASSNKEELGDYGWNFFTSATPEAKKHYMLSQLMYSVPYMYKEIMFNVLDEIGQSAARSTIADMSVDHQSVMTFPKTAYGDIHMGFFDSYTRYICDNDFLVLGGNDNTDSEHELAQYDDGKDSYMYDFLSDDVAYLNNNYWVVINSNRKLRIAFDDVEPFATMPELVDLKITDFCDIGCDFCYQDSTTQGTHAPLQDVKRILSQTSPYGVVTEYAIGGGEPTQHPDFAEILHAIYTNINIANFTTKNKKWFKDADLVNTVGKTVTGIAYSIDNTKDLNEFFELHRHAFPMDSDYGTNGRQESKKRAPVFYVHLIPELMGQDAFRDLLADIESINAKRVHLKPKINVTLLGFKPIGRSEGDEVSLIPEIIDILQLTKNTPIGIDTKFAQDYKEFLELKEVDSTLYTTEEGEFSLYVDAVKDTAYKSSYHLENPVALTDYSNARSSRLDIKEVFQKIKEGNG